MPGVERVSAWAGGPVEVDLELGGEIHWRGFLWHADVGEVTNSEAHNSKKTKIQG